jgi:hypothetical protein
VSGGARSPGKSPIAVPDVPTRASRRGASVESQRADANDGRFTERFLEFIFPPIPPGTSATVRLAMQSMGGRFTRITGLRGTLLTTSAPEFGLGLANLLLKFQLGAAQDMIVNGQGFTSLAILCGGSPDPWFHFAAPPRIRTGDTMQATFFNAGFLEGGAAPTLQPEFTIKIIDDEIYRRLYELDLQAELEVEDDHDQQDAWEP